MPDPCHLTSENDTFTGQTIDLQEPTPSMVHLMDIAVHLSRLPRFNGGTRTDLAYSVAEHSVLVSRLVQATEPDAGLWGLFHDAAEAYLGDIVTPFKRTIERIKATEGILLRAVADKFRLPWPPPAVVKLADNIALATEGRDYMGWDDAFIAQAADGAEPIPFLLDEPLDEHAARDLFLDRFAELAPTETGEPW